MTFISRTALSAVATVLLIAMAPSAQATNGIDAARACENNPKCTSTFSPDGSVVIVIDGKVIYCGGPKEECVIVRKHLRKNRPTAYEGGKNGKNSNSNAGMSGAKDTGGEKGGGNSGTEGNTGSANMNNAGMSAGNGGGTIN